MVEVRRKRLQLQKRERSRDRVDPEHRAEEAPNHRKPLKWICENLIVRFISKKQPKLYGKELSVVQVNDAYTFSCKDAANTLYDDLREKDLETVLPGSKQISAG